MNKISFSVILSLALLVTMSGLCSLFAQDPGSASSSGINPVYVPGNPSCCDLGYGNVGFKIEGAPIGTFTFSSSNGTFTCSTGQSPEDQMIL